MSKVSKAADREIDCDNTQHEDQVEEYRVCLLKRFYRSETLKEVMLGDSVVAAPMDKPFWRCDRLKFATTSFRKAII